MKSLFRPSKSKIQKAYEAKLKEARDAQRDGKIQVFAELMEEANALYFQLAGIDPSQDGSPSA